MLNNRENYNKLKLSMEKLPIGKSFYFLLRRRECVNVSCIRSTYPNGVAYPVTVIGIFPDGSMIYSTSNDSLDSMMKKLDSALSRYYGLHVYDDVILVADIVDIRTTN